MELLLINSRPQRVVHTNYMDCKCSMCQAHKREVKSAGEAVLAMRSPHYQGERYPVLPL